MNNHDMSTTKVPMEFNFVFQFFGFVSDSGAIKAKNLKSVNVLNGMRRHENLEN